MKKKILGILVCTLLIATTFLPVGNTMSDNKYQTVSLIKNMDWETALEKNKDKIIIENKRSDIEKIDSSGKKYIDFVQDADFEPMAEVIPKSRDTMGMCVDSNFYGVYYINTNISNINFQHLQIPNAGHMTEIGKPAVPVITRYFEIPHDVYVSINIIYENPYIVSDFFVIPAQEPPEDHPNATIHPFTIDWSTYNQSDFYPSNIATIKGENHHEAIMIRGIRILELSLYPIQFNPATRQLKVNSKIEVRLDYETPAQVEEIDPRLESPAFEKLYQSFILNYKYRPGFNDKYSHQSTSNINNLNPFTLSNGADYLIITHDNFFNEVQPLAEWKEKKGLLTKIVNTSDIKSSGPNADEISDYIKDAYNTWNPVPSYILLVGDSEFIPTHYKNPSESDSHGGFNTATDLFYGTVDGTDYFPDIYVGRLSVDTANQATTIVDKILNYERTPPANPDFYNEAAACAYFQDDDVYHVPSSTWITQRDGYEDRRFVLTCEEIRDYLNSEGYNVDRIYCADAAVNPTRYSPAPIDYWSWDLGLPLPSGPSGLLRPTFAWNGNTNNITNAINDGRFLIFHRDHGLSENFWHHDNSWWGWYDGWGDPYFDTGNINSLTNGDLLPVVFSVECQCGWFDNEIDQLDDPILTHNVECFSEEFLRLQNGGAIAVIGATRNSKSGYNDQMIRGFIDAIWPDFDTDYATGGLFSLGQVMTFGKIYMSYEWGSGYTDVKTRYTFELFHLFGDPEMEIWTEQPQNFNAIHPDKIGSGSSQKFVVTVKDLAGNPIEHSRVCLSKENDIYEVYYTNSAGEVLFDITPSSSGLIDITVTKHNFIPYEGVIIVTDPGATLSVIPDFGPAGILVDIEGNGFSGSEIVDIKFPPATTTATASSGSFTLSYNVPSNGEGPVNVIAEGRTSNKAAVALFRRLPDQPLPDPYIYDQWDPTTWANLNPAGNDPRWNNPCIQLYDGTTPINSNDLVVGTNYKIEATIYNDQSVDAVDTDVTFEWAFWGAGQKIWYHIFTDTITVPAASGSVSGSAVASTFWTPSITGHTCLMISIYHPWDENINNNKGQENTDVHPVSSPGIINFEITNPTNETALIYLETRQVEKQSIWSARLTRDYPQIQEPGETKDVTLTVNPPSEGVRTYSVSAYIDGELIGGIETEVVKGEPENHPPYTPTITGPASGKSGVEHEYTFVTTDPDDDQLYYYIDWGDGSNSGWIGHCDSGVEIVEAYIWTGQGDYVIRAKAKDTNDAESDWTTLEVSMPKTKPYLNIPFLKFLQQHPLIYQLLQRLLRL